jgi:hypothetical protein
MGKRSECMNQISTHNNFCNFDTTTLKGYEMRTLVNRFTAAMAALSLVTIVFVLAGCGGGSGGGGVSAEVVSGTAAVGAPLAGKVTLKDSSTPTQQRATTIGNDGSYAIDVTGLKAPFVLQATGSANGAAYTLQSFAEGAGTANINPLSNIIVASAAGDDDPEDVFDKADSEKSKRIKTNLSKTVTLLLKKLQPLLSQYSSENTNPITARYINRKLDLDDMYENVKISVSNGTLSIINTKTKAVIFSGTISDIANGIFDGGALPPAASAPSAPSGLTATGGSCEISLSWSTVSTATSYNVYYASVSGVSTTNGTKIASVSSPYLHSGLTAGTTYYYVVTAVNSAGESTPSAQKSATVATTPPVPAAPAAPAGVSATGGTKQVTLSWKTVKSATSYNIYYAQASGVTKATGTKIANVATPAVQTGLADNTTYYYIVTAVNSTGESTASTEVSATTLSATPTTTAPAAPTSVKAAGGSAQATVTWTKVSGATSYNIYWSTTAGVTTSTGTKVTGAVSPATVSGLSADTAYYFVVTAVNSTGESVVSAEANATTNAPTSTCGSCHAIPPASGKHSFHVNSKGYGCATCHGTGYSSSVVTAATHMNGTIDIGGSSNWNASSRSCSNSCHGTKSW